MENSFENCQGTFEKFVRNANNMAECLEWLSISVERMESAMKALKVSLEEVKTDSRLLQDSYALLSNKEGEAQDKLA